MLKRFFNLGFNAWKKRKQSGTYLSFYMRNPEDSRNKLARILDFTGILLVIWLVSFTLLSGVTKNQKALLFSIALLIISLVITDIIKRYQLQKKLQNTRREMTKQKYLEELEQMSQVDFYDYAKKVLEKYGINCKSEYINEQSFEATLGQGPVLVKFFGDEDAVNAAQVQKVNDEIVENEFHAAILVIQGEAPDDINTTLEDFSDEYIEIVDKNRLAKLATNLEQTYSTDEDFSQLEQHQEKVTRWKYLKNQIIGYRKKTKSYAITGSILILLSIFWQNSLTLSVIYAAFGILNLTLSIFSYNMEKQKAKAQLLKP